MPPTYYYYLHILIPFFTSYTFYNASRRSFADTSLKLLSDNTITEAQYARVNSITSTLYGVSKYVASIVLNYVSPKTTYLFGLLMSSIVVTVAGLFLKNGSVMAYLITWVVTTLFYGFCWPSIAFMVRLWVPSYVRGIIWSFMNITTSSGAILGNFFMKMLKGQPPYKRYTSIGISTLLFVPYCIYILPSKNTSNTSIDDDEKEASLPLTSSDLEEQTTILHDDDQQEKNETMLNLKGPSYPVSPTVTVEKERMKLTKRIIVIAEPATTRTHAYDNMNTKLFLTSVVTVITYLTRYTLAEWGHILYPKIHSSIPQEVLRQAIDYYETGGIISTILIGYISDTFGISRITLCCWSTLCCCLSVYFLSFNVNAWFFAFLNLVNGLTIYIPFSFIELITIESVPASKANHIGAINNLIQQVGCLLSTIPIQYLIEHYGYTRVLPFLSFLLAISFVHLLALMYVSRNDTSIKKE